MARPVAETQPQGLDAYWSGCWQHVLMTLKGQGTWAWEQKPLVDEYVFALIEAEGARLDGEPARWDRASKRASALADLLVLTPKTQRRLAGREVSDDGDPFDALDELEQKRQAKGA